VAFDFHNATITEHRMNRTPTYDYPLRRGDEISVLAVDYRHGTKPAGVAVERVEREGKPSALTPEEEDALNQWIASHHFDRDPPEDDPEDDFNDDY